MNIYGPVLMKKTHIMGCSNILSMLRLKQLMRAMLDAKMCTINDWERNYPTMKDDVFTKIADDLIENKKDF